MVEQAPPPKKKGLTPVQIGGGVGAAVACVSVLVVQKLSPVAAQGGVEGGFSRFLLGVWTAIGAMAGMAVVALTNVIRLRNKADSQGAQDSVGS